MNIEMLEYGDKVELRNGKVYVCVRRELDIGGGIICQEVNLINIFNGEEINVSCYKDDLTHERDPELDIIRFAN